MLTSVQTLKMDAGINFFWSSTQQLQRVDCNLVLNSYVATATSLWVNYRSPESTSLLPDDRMCIHPPPHKGHSSHPVGKFSILLSGKICVKKPTGILSSKNKPKEFLYFELISSNLNF